METDNVIQLNFKCMIKTENLQKVFRTDEVETWALNNVSIEVKEGEFVPLWVLPVVENPPC